MATTTKLKYTAALGTAKNGLPSSGAMTLGDGVIPIGSLSVCDKLVMTLLCGALQTLAMVVRILHSSNSIRPTTMFCSVQN
jgi:hypothetical protein